MGEAWDYGDGLCGVIDQQQDRIAALEQALRDCLNVIDTGEGLWCADQPSFQYMEYAVPAIWFMSKSRRKDYVEMSAAPGTYWRQTFSDNQGVKRARGLVSR